MTAVEPTTDPAPEPAPEPVPAPPATPAVDPPSISEAVPGARAVSGEPDKVDFTPGGATTMIIAGERYKLRCPTWQEMDPFRQSWNATVASLQGGQKDPAWDVIAWMKDVINAFGDHPYNVPDDKLPAWMTSGGLPSRVLNHWRTIPTDDTPVF